MPLGIKYFLDQTGSHQRNVSTKDANGGDVAAWTVLVVSRKFAVWPIDSVVQHDYARSDIVVTHSICTDKDLGATASDKIVIGSVHYIVRGLEPFSNAAIANFPVYVMHCERRVVG